MPRFSVRSVEPTLTTTRSSQLGTTNEYVSIVPFVPRIVIGALKRSVSKSLSAIPVAPFAYLSVTSSASSTFGLCKRAFALTTSGSLPKSARETMR